MPVERGFSNPRKTKKSVLPIFFKGMKTLANRAMPLANRLPIASLAALLLLSGCGSDERQDPLLRLIEEEERQSDSAPTNSEEPSTVREDDYAALYGPGRLVEVGPYSTVTPNGAWLNRSLAGSLFLVRLADPTRDAEVGYVEAYRLPDLPRRTAAALAAGADLVPAMAEDLRELIEERAVKPSFLEGELGSPDGSLSATVAYHDYKRGSRGEPERAYNEVSLLLVGGEAHILAGYCFADERGLFTPEYRRIAERLFIEPPPKPVLEEAPATSGAGE